VERCCHGLVCCLLTFVEVFHTRLERLDGRSFDIHQLDVAGTGRCRGAVIIHHQCCYDGRTHGRGNRCDRRRGRGERCDRGRPRPLFAGSPPLLPLPGSCGGAFGGGLLPIYFGKLITPCLYPLRNFLKQDIIKRSQITSYAISEGGDLVVQF
jgi:hypothetical protein